MEHGIGRAARRRDGSDGVAERSERDDLLRANIFAQQVHHELAAIDGDLPFARVHGGNFICAEGRNSEKGDRRGHGVGGELAAASAGARAGVVFEVAEFLRGHFSGRAGADGFEHVLNGDVVALKTAGHDRAAVKRKRRQIQTRESHHGGGNGLVAAANRNDGVKRMRHGEKFDRIGDHFAGDERGFHALGAHGDAVGNGDGVELDGRAAGGADAFLHFFRERAEVEIAGRHFRPRVRDGHERARQVGVGEAGGLQHRAGGRPRNSFFDCVTLHFGMSLRWRSIKKPRSLFSGAGRARRNSAQTGGPHGMITITGRLICRVIEYRLMLKWTNNFVGGKGRERAAKVSDNEASIRNDSAREVKLGQAGTRRPSGFECAVDNTRVHSKTVQMNDNREIENVGKATQISGAVAGEPAATAGAGGHAAKPCLDEEQEKILAAKASRDMWTAILIIVGSFVFVLVAAVVVMMIAHVQIF